MLSLNAKSVKVSVRYLFFFCFQAISYCSRVLLYLKNAPLPADC